MLKDTVIFLHKIKLPLALILVLWLIKAADYLFDLNLKSLGIYPREISGLIGIFTSPFIHSNWDHLYSNTMPILVLTSIMTIFYRKVAVSAYFTIMIGTGLLVWLFARESQWQ